MIVEAHKGYPLVEDVNCSKKKKNLQKAQKWLRWMMCGSRSGGFKCYKVTGHALSLCPKARVHPLWVPWHVQASFMGNVPDRADYSPFFMLSTQLRRHSVVITFLPLSLLSCLLTEQEQDLSSRVSVIKSLMTPKNILHLNLRSNLVTIDCLCFR